MLTTANSMGGGGVMNIASTKSELQRVFDIGFAPRVFRTRERDAVCGSVGSSEASTMSTREAQ